jgi:hypothetical protein
MKLGDHHFTLHINSFTLIYVPEIMGDFLIVLQALES